MSLQSAVILNIQILISINGEGQAIIPLPLEHFVCLCCSSRVIIMCSIFSEIFPYLVVMVGMEKVMIIVRAVVSTPASNPVKIRIAEGISVNLMLSVIISRIINHILIFC